MPGNKKLRNLGKFLGVYLLAALGAMVLLISCDKIRHVGPDNYDVANDSVKIAQLIEDFNNPQFSSVAEIVEYRMTVKSTEDVDSVFFSMNSSTIQNVASVLFKKNATIKKKDIVEEYLRCRNVYDNLPTSNALDTTTTAKNNSVDRTGTDLGNRRPNKTTINFRTDTIDGKPVKVMIRTEETYE